MDVLNIKLEPRSNLSINNDDNLSSYSPVSTSSHNLNNTNNINNNISNNGSNALDYYNDANLLINSHLNSAPSSYNNTSSNSNNTSNTTNKIRKRSANQAYEYLTTLADSKTFQEWLVNNETDFTWVHKRNSMTNAGKKYYYICNYRIKKGFVRCPAVIYALFPNNEENTVMVYSCGDHVHRRIGSGGSGGVGVGNNSSNNTNDSANLLNNPSSLLGYGYDEHNMTINDDDNEIENDSSNNNNNNPTTTNISTSSSSTLHHHQKLRKTISYNDINNNKLNVNSQQKNHHQHQQSHHSIHQNEINNEYDEDNDDDMSESLFHQHLALQQQQQLHYQSSHKQHKQQNHSNETLSSNINNNNNTTTTTTNTTTTTTNNNNNNTLSTSSSASSSPSSSSLTSTSIIQQQLQNQQITNNSSRIHSRKRSISSIDPKVNDQVNDNNNNNNCLDNNSAASINSYINSIHSKQKSKSRKDLLSKDSNATNSVAAAAASIANSLLNQSNNSSLSNLHNQFIGHHTSSSNNIDIEMKLCKNGMPRAAALTMDNAPVHIDVGGCLYTSSLETLSRHPESKLSKMFNGTIPIVLDTLKQHYFIDRDGKLFRHILNFMRTNRLVLPENFDEFDSLIDEARYFELDQLVKQIEQLLHKRKKQTCDCITNCSCSTNSSSSLLSRSQLKAKQTQSIIRSAFQSYNSNNNNNTLSNDNNCSCSNDASFNQNENRLDNNTLNGSTNNRSLVQILNNGMTSNNKNHHHHHHHGHSCHFADSPCSETNNEHEKGSCKILILNHTENSLYISGESALIKNLLPELDEDNYSNNILLNSCKYATKFCLDGSINVHYIEMMERLYDNQFVMEACYGGGLEGQQFNEYIFVKCKTS